jgi:hypothetical protein
LPESLEQRDSAVVTSAGEPGLLSRLLQELADASGEDRAFEWLAHAFAARDNDLNMIQVDPLLRGVHGDPCYTAMLRKLGLQVD